MKKDLLALINQLNTIRAHFHIAGGNGLPLLNVIYDKVEFSIWKQEIQFELQAIYDQTKDNSIWSTLVILKQGFSGWKDEQSFNDLSGSLFAIKKNIDKYYCDEPESVYNIKEVHIMEKKKSKVFISHSSYDKDIVMCIVNLLEDIGLKEEQIFCSSATGYGIPLNEDIYSYLKNQFQDYDLHVIFILSDNYYKSIACMNEMGAAWVLQNKYTTLLLPGFEFNEIKGAINPRQIGLKLDCDITEIKEKLGQLKEGLILEFGLDNIKDVRWERKRDDFIYSISQSVALNDKTITVNKLLQPEQPKLQWGCYIFEGINGLYCPVCFETNGQKILVPRLTGGHRKCPKCKAELS